VVHHHRHLVRHVVVLAVDQVLDRLWHESLVVHHNRACFVSHYDHLHSFLSTHPILNHDCREMDLLLWFRLDARFIGLPRCRGLTILDDFAGMTGAARILAWMTGPPTSCP